MSQSLFHVPSNDTVASVTIFVCLILTHVRVQWIFKIEPITRISQRVRSDVCRLELVVTDQGQWSSVDDPTQTVVDFSHKKFTFTCDKHMSNDVQRNASLVIWDRYDGTNSNITDTNKTPRRFRLRRLISIVTKAHLKVNVTFFSTDTSSDETWTRHNVTTSQLNDLDSKSARPCPVVS